MMGPRPWDPVSRAALGAAVAAVLLVVLSTVGAWLIEPLPEAGSSGPRFRVAEAPMRDSLVTARAIRTVAENNPFRPDRHRPEKRYLPPAQRVTAAQLPPRRAAFVPAFILEGIAWTPGRPGVAIMGVAGQPARLLQVGEVIESFRIRTIEETRVTLVSPDTTVVLTLDPWAGEAATSPNNRGRIR